MQLPATVEKGEIQWAINASGAGGDGKNTSASTDPNFEAAIRYGVADNFDIGLKLNFLGAQIGAKYQLLRGNFDLSLGLEAGYQWVRTGGMDDPSSHVLSFQLPVYMEYHINPFVGISFGPKFLGIYVPKTDERTEIWGSSAFYTGLMLGLPLRLAPGITLLPEVNVYASIVDENKDVFKAVLWQAGASVIFTVP
ncbi:MAG: hypothetical protein WC966_00330 [Bradymonadales bacterium]